jgi:hypothetical protein
MKNCDDVIKENGNECGLENDNKEDIKYNI